MRPCKGLFHYKGVLSHGLRTTGLGTPLAHKGLRNGVTALHGHLSQGGFTLGTKTQARSPGEVLVLTIFFSLHVQAQIPWVLTKKIFSLVLLNGIK